MYPNMSRVIDRWARPYFVKNVTRQTVDFVESNVVTQRTVKAIIQPANKDKLNTEQIDWSLRYIQVHTLDDSITNGEFIQYQGQDYKIIDNGNYNDFGYIEFVGEQTKQSLLQVTP